jgi:hypothetical protein
LGNVRVSHGGGGTELLSLASLPSYYTWE